MLNKIRRAAEKAVAPGSVLSYAQSGEDLVLDFLTGYSPSGFYVDVGCNHPVRISNSYRFYRKGWRGVCIDANSAFEPMFAAKRPRDTFVRACVSDKPETLTFHHFAENALSSVSGVNFYENAEHYALKRVEDVEARTLTDILDEVRCPSSFDILSIDVEGQDEKALQGLDLHKYKPRVVVVEAQGVDVGNIAMNPMARQLSDHGYQPIAAHWTNLFFRLR